MDKVQKKIRSQCYTPSSERVRIYNIEVFRVMTPCGLVGGYQNLPWRWRQYVVRQLPNLTIRFHTFFKKSKSHLQILGTRIVTRSKFHNEDPQILGARVQNLVARAICAPLLYDVPKQRPTNRSLKSLNILRVPGILKLKMVPNAETYGITIIRLMSRQEAAADSCQINYDHIGGILYIVINKCFMRRTRTSACPSVCRLGTAPKMDK
jgi:hypothetical protein